jgi:hypothetical protein
MMSVWDEEISIVLRADEFNEVFPSLLARSLIVSLVFATDLFIYPFPSESDVQKCL